MGLDIFKGRSTEYLEGFRLKDKREKGNVDRVVKAATELLEDSNVADGIVELAEITGNSTYGELSEDIGLKQQLVAAEAVGFEFVALRPGDRVVNDNNDPVERMKLPSFITPGKEAAAQKLAQRVFQGNKTDIRREAK